MMLEYIPLYFIAFVWIIFAVVQDLRTREISNWLNFSLIAFALAYRAFYSSYLGEWSFFLWGAGGFFLFWLLAYGLYYARAFAGGDAKLLMGLGAVLPFDSLWSYAAVSFVFILLLFTLGAIYSLVYTVFLAVRDKERFAPEFRKQMIFLPSIKVILSGIIVLFCMAAVLLNIYFALVLAGFVALALMLIVYIKSIEKACFIRLVSPKDLTEGDWLVDDVRVAGKTIKKTVHGLTLKEIALLRKHRKKVLVKYGIPFGPAFLFAIIAFLVIVYKYTEFLIFFGLG